MSVARNVIIFAIFSCFFLLAGMPWIIIIFFLFYGLIIIFLKSKIGERLERYFFLQSSIYFLFIFFLAIVLRVFVFETFAIPTSSMEDHLLQGDKIVVSKLNYGPQLPRSRFEIPWLNFFFYLIEDKPVRNIEFDYVRLNGFSKIKRNDIVVFDIPTESKDIIIKRCLGLPGDLFEIKNAEIIINEQPYDPPGSVKNFYKLQFDSWPDFLAALEYLKINIDDRKIDLKIKGQAILILSKSEKIKLSAVGSIKSIELTQQPNPLEFLVFTKDQFGWTYDNFGPVKVPQKGLKVNLNKNSFVLYSYILEKYEKAEIIFSNGKFILNGVEINSYTFKNNYYLMIGDNRSASLDSRFYGFVCEENILGKAWFVIFSNGNDGLRWNRFFHIL